MLAALALTGCERQGDDARSHGSQAVTEATPEALHADRRRVALGPAQVEELGIALATAEPSDLALQVRLSGEVTFNADQVAHVVPRVPGVVREVYKTVGDTVRRGEILAVLDSRELARAKADYLAARARLALAGANFAREEKLWRGKISAESKFLNAKQALEEAEIEAGLAERQLYALGFSERDLERLSQQTDVELTRYELAAPLDGTIVERHLTRGEVIPEQPPDPPFVIADLSTVWVSLTVYPKDLDVVRAGQTAIIVAEHGALQARGAIAYVSPSVREETRTATARVVLDNPAARWRPGLFVTAAVETGTRAGRVVVPRAAVQSIDGESVVFVQTDAGFEPREVELGEVSGDRVEVTEGLRPGERYVSENAFTLKAELGREALEHAGHGH